MPISKLDLRKKCTHENFGQKNSFQEKLQVSLKIGFLAITFSRSLPHINLFKGKKTLDPIL
jgi:hypothetical protein